MCFWKNKKRSTGGSDFVSNCFLISDEGTVSGSHASNRPVENHRTKSFFCVFDTKWTQMVVSKNYFNCWFVVDCDTWHILNAESSVWVEIKCSFKNASDAELLPQCNGSTFTLPLDGFSLMCMWSVCMTVCMSLSACVCMSMIALAHLCVCLVNCIVCVHVFCPFPLSNNAFPQTTNWHFSLKTGYVAACQLS